MAAITLQQLQALSNSRGLDSKCNRVFDAARPGPGGLLFTGAGKWRHQLRLRRPTATGIRWRTNHRVHRDHCSASVTRVARSGASAPTCLDRAGISALSTVQRLLTRGVGQVGPVLQQMDAQHAIQPNGRAAIARLRVMRLDQRHHTWPQHQHLHLGQQRLAPRGLAVTLEIRGRIGSRCQGHLPHDRNRRRTSPRRQDGLLRWSGTEQRFPLTAAL